MVAKTGNHDQEIFEALISVLERYESFRQLGALAGEGGERAFRGWLLGGFLQPAMGWSWRNVVLGESLDVLTLDWRDFAVIYIETKTPDSPLTIQHRREMTGRAPRWGSLRHLFLTNCKIWERFDLPAMSQGVAEVPDAIYQLDAGPAGCSGFFDAFDARRYQP